MRTHAAGIFGRAGLATLLFWNYRSVAPRISDLASFRHVMSRCSASKDLDNFRSRFQSEDCQYWRWAKNHLSSFSYAEEIDDYYYY